VCFLMCLLLANYSCLEQWKRILGLVLTCRDALERQPGFFAEFLRVLRMQLGHCNDVEGGMFDIKDDSGGFLKGLLKGFGRTVEDVFGGDEESEVRTEMKALEGFLSTGWKWEMGDSFVRKGMVQLEDGEDVELELDELEGEDERGEYAPVIVQLEEGQLG
ncbi:MAG: hypothetical protein LQ340_005773, partial [Diploschistes diacapsis]